MFRTIALTAALLASAAPALAERVRIDLTDFNEVLLPTEVLAGDREFGGNGPHIVVETRLEVVNGGRAIDAIITFRAEETGGDGSFTRITRPPFRVWQGLNNEIVDYIVGNPVARVEWISSAGCTFGCGILGPSEDGGAITTRMGDPAGYIVSVTALGDTSGDDISDDQNPHGDTSLRGIDFRPITVEIRD